MAAMYLVLVTIILHQAKASPAGSLQAISISCVGLAIGTALQALPRGPIGSGFLAPAAVAFLRKKAQAWRVGTNTIETSADHTGRVIEYILGKHSTHREGISRASYNGVDLRVELIYEGSLAEHLPPSHHAGAPADNELENEESAAYVGLQNFLRGLAVDRQQLKTQGDRISIRLFYAV
jgi:hypothetical protein